MNLEAKIEAILFWKGEPVSLKKLALWLGVAKEAVESALGALEKKLTERGVALLRKDDEVALGTAPALGELMERLVKEELAGELSKASLETLTIILYRGPVGKQEIDYIRGVNSGYTLRSLLIRGLTERLENPSDRRTHLYKPTFELLSYMGIKRLTDLPDYQAVKEEIKNGELSEQN
ncbi:MAG: SMC-Scp complex subunit ScpB [Patescibacteria group bacterium]